MFRRKRFRYWLTNSTSPVPMCTGWSRSTTTSVREPAGRTTVRICRGEACQAVGAERLVSHLRDTCGMSLGETSLDGSLTVEQVFCLGNCALGPAAQVNGRLQGRLDEARLSSIVDEAVAQ